MLNHKKAQVQVSSSSVAALIEALPAREMKKSHHAATVPILGSNSVKGLAQLFRRTDASLSIEGQSIDANALETLARESDLDFTSHAERKLAWEKADAEFEQRFADRKRVVDLAVGTMRTLYKGNKTVLAELQLLAKQHKRAVRRRERRLSPRAASNPAGAPPQSVAAPAPIASSNAAVAEVSP